MKNSVPTQFTKDRQPSPQAKSAGWAKKKKGTELDRAILEVTFKGLDNSPVKKEAAEYFGIPEKDIKVEMMMHFAQVRKAIEDGDTHAYDVLMRRAYGTSKENTAKVTAALVPLPVELTIEALKNLAGVPQETKTDWDAVEPSDIEEIREED